MDANEKDQPDMDFEDTYSDQSVHSDSLDSSDTFRESELHPRVGKEYQALIPSLLTPSEWHKYLADGSHNFLIGLPVPIIFGCKDTKTIKDEEIRGLDTSDCPKMEPIECATEFSSVSDKKDSSIKGDCVNQKCVANGFVDIVPGLQGDSWSEFQVECFLLGLYLFGKNLLQVKNFMEGKEMGQILSFYYGKFYRTAKYQRWADCRKIRGRKCIIGQRILSGSRQQELLSRLLPHLSEASRNTLVEAYRAFMDGKTSLEEYVSMLKSMVGIRALVEAVRIGKENEDLTVMAMESSRTNPTVSSRPEMPSGKACSSLTYEEIVKYLTGDFRLSKARSSDLFWEAVWPRLLAKGWHSEKPKDDEVYIRGSKNPLVFLLPGIKKFRRKLLKGDHYFDSVSDVLKKVASEPQLLVLETEENGAMVSVKDNGSGSEPNSDEDGGSDLEHHRYLQPRSSSEAANHMKFTIVDTSLYNEDESSSTVRELRSLPAEMLSWVRRPREAEHCSDEPKNICDHVSADNVPKSVKISTDHALKRRRLNACSNKAEKKPVIRSCSEAAARHHSFVLSLPAHSKKAARKSHTEARTHNRATPVCSKPVAGDNHGEKKKAPVCSKPVAADNHGEKKKTPVCSKPVAADNHGEKKKTPVCSTSVAAGNHGEKKKTPVCSTSVAADNHGEKKKTPVCSLVAADNGEEKKKSDCSLNATVNETRDQSQGSQLLIDLNVPQLSAEPEPEANTNVNAEEANNVLTQNGTNLHLENPIEQDEQANGNVRRHSTRIRPLSTRALEALESSFFNPKIGKKRPHPEDEKPPKVSRRARSKSSAAPAVNCTVDAAMEEKRSDQIHSADMSSNIDS